MYNLNMQGYILNVNKFKEEDCIVDILTQHHILKTYRFYGSRHSSIMQGFKIDFTIQQNNKFLPQLRDVIHLGDRWVTDNQRLFIWQNFIKILYKHLNGIDSIDEFYFKYIDEARNKFNKQNPKRTIIEAYIKILNMEGRLNYSDICFVCDEKINEKIAIARSLNPAHENCIYQHGFSIKKLHELYRTQTTIKFDNDEIEQLFKVVMLGF